MTFYTVQLNKAGFPVKYSSLADEGHIKTFPGPFGDPGEACNEFEASHENACYMEPTPFQSKVRALARLHKSKQ